MPRDFLNNTEEFLLVLTSLSYELYSIATPHRMEADDDAE